MKRISVLIPIALLLLLSPSALTQTQAKPDLLLLNAHIITMNPGKPSAEAVAVMGDDEAVRVRQREVDGVRLCGHGHSLSHVTACSRLLRPR